jgi:hypothetical protein
MNVAYYIVAGIAAILWRFAEYLLKFLASKFFITAILMVCVAFLYEYFWPQVVALIPAYVMEGNTNLVNFVNSLPSGVLYFLELSQIQYGLPLVVGAYLARFAVRRIPFFG